MDAKRWAIIESLYHAALQKAPGERSSYLAVACADDSTLRSEIESLLVYADAQFLNPAQNSKMTELLDKIGGIGPSDGVDLVGVAAVGTPPTIPATIGRYRILRLLGEGGMGAVYEAEQEQPRRTVALKVIKPGLATPELLRRFEQESQALGRLQHPGIAQIYEAGTANSGFGPQPFFAMEFIEGESLLQYAEAHQLKTRQRLELMAKVCEAVQHAHQRGVIHRDLKPGNILADMNGQPKVLDFGVARVTDSNPKATRQTDVGRLVGTLAYMSPEQVLADSLEVDTRSDVYALGVILYELLVGRAPYTVSRNIPEAVQTIREEDPAPLSSISRNYRGDIETIVAKALEKDKARRYASAAGLAGDIRRYLTDEPILARPPSATYQLQKFARRHKALVTGVVAVFVVLIAGIIVSTWEATRARRAEQAATAQAATAKAVNDFLQNDLLAQASAKAQARPDNKPDPDLKVRTALDRAGGRITGKFTGQPLVEASIRQTIGKTYRDLGLYPDAQRQVERALDLRHRILGEEHPDTLATMNELATLYRDQGKYPQAERLFTKVLEVRRRALGEEHPDTLATINDLAVLYRRQGKYAQAEPLFTKILEVRRRVLGKDRPETLTTMNDLGVLYTSQGKYALAESLLTKALEVKRRTLGEEHPDTLINMNNLGQVYQYEDKYADAELLYAKVAELHRHVLGEDHPEALISMNNLAQIYLYQGKYAQAGPLFSKILEVRRRVRGDEHPETLVTMNDLAVLYTYQRKYAQAEQLFTKVLEVKRRVLGEGHPETLISMDNLAFLYRNQGKYALAEPLNIKALTLQRRTLGAEHLDTLISMNDLEFLYLNERKYAPAEALLREALNRFDKAAPESWRRFDSQSMLGASLAAQKRYAEAETLLLSGYDGLLNRKSTIPTASRFKLNEAGEQIVELYQDWGMLEKAAEWRDKLKLTTSSTGTQ